MTIEIISYVIHSEHNHVENIENNEYKYHLE